MEHIYKAKLEIILPYNINQIKKGRVKSYAVDSIWKLADKDHRAYVNNEVVLINNKNKWLGLSKEDLNNCFEIILK